MRFMPPLLILSLLLAACGETAVSHHGNSSPPLVPPHPVTIMLDWTINSDHGGIFTALRKGYFARNSVAPAPKVPSSSTVPIQLVASHRADFALAYETDVLAARARHIPIRSVMCIMQHPLDTIMSLKSSGITRPRDLAGKTVGMAGSPSDQPIVAAVMRRDGSSIARAHMVNVGYSLLPALLSHRVDAVVGVYWTWEALQAQARGAAVNVMRVERWGVPNYCELTLVTSDTLIKTQPALVRDTVRAMQEGYAYAAAHPSYAWVALHHADPSLGRSLVLHSLQLLGPIETDAREVGYQNPGQWQTYATWLRHNHLIAAPVRAQTAFTNQFLDPNVR